MSDGIGIVVDGSGKVYGQSELASQLAGWLTHPRVGPVLVARKVAASPYEVMLVARDLPTLTKRGLSLCILWLTSDSIVRRRLIAVRAVAEQRSRREARESLEALIEWATIHKSKLSLN